MNKKVIVITSLLVSGLALGQVNNVKFLNMEQKSNESLNIEIKKDISKQDMTVGEMAEILKTKREHYPLSDEFIEKYQQNSGGYIDYAKELGLVVDKQLHEPNQKWHFLTSWLQVSIDQGSISLSESAKTRVYTKLLCPELLLWIYEASGVDPVKVKAAKVVAEDGKVKKLTATTIAKNMRAVVSWDDFNI